MTIDETVQNADQGIEGIETITDFESDINMELVKCTKITLPKKFKTILLVNTIISLCSSALICFLSRKYGSSTTLYFCAIGSLLLSSLYVTFTIQYWRQLYIAPLSYEQFTTILGHIESFLVMLTLLATTIQSFIENGQVFYKYNDWISTRGTLQVVPEALCSVILIVMFWVKLLSANISFHMLSTKRDEHERLMYKQKMELLDKKHSRKTKEYEQEMKKRKLYKLNLDNIKDIEKEMIKLATKPIYPKPPSIQSSPQDIYSTDSVPPYAYMV